VSAKTTTMRVTIGELLGKVSAEDGQALEQNLRKSAWEAERAEELKARPTEHRKSGADSGD
jgi:hypothetical protein